MFNGPMFLLATAYQKLLERVTPLHCLQGWIFFVLRKPAAAAKHPTIVARPAA